MASSMVVDLDGKGSVTVPSRVVSAADAGAFVLEGDPIPVVRPTLTGVALSPRKVAAIMVYTIELAKRSTPSIEAVVGQIMREATALALDAALFSSTAGSATRPAGLFNGVTATTASTATPAGEAMMRDVEALVGAVATAGGGSSVAIVTDPGRAAALRLRAGSAFDIPVLASNAMAAGSVAAVDTGSLVFGFGPDPDIDASSEATLHLEDTAPAQIGTTGTPAVVAAPTRSLLQSGTIGVRMMLDCAWGLRAPQVAYITEPVGW